MHDDELSRALTARIRRVPGVTGVHAPRPIAHAAAAAVSTALEQEPDGLVSVDRDGTTLRVTAHVAVGDDRPAPDTVREVGERIRDLADAQEPPRADLVTVVIRLVDGVGGPRSGSEPDPDLDATATAAG